MIEVRIRNKKPELILLKQFLSFLKARNQPIDQVNHLVELGAILQYESPEKVERFCIHSLPYSISQFIWDISSCRDGKIVDYKFNIDPDFHWVYDSTKALFSEPNRETLDKIKDFLIRAIFFINQVQVRNNLIKHHLEISWSMNEQSSTDQTQTSTNQVLSHLTKAVNDLSESMKNFSPQQITISGNDITNKVNAQEEAPAEKPKENEYNLDSLNPGSLL